MRPEAAGHMFQVIISASEAEFRREVLYERVECALLKWITNDRS